MIRSRTRSRVHRLASAAIAVLLVLSMNSPGVTALAAEVAPPEGAVSQASTEAVEPAAAEVPDPVASSPEAPAPVTAAPEASVKPGPASDEAPVSVERPKTASAEDTVKATRVKVAAAAVAARSVSALAIVDGTSTNLSFTFEGVRRSSGWITGNLQNYNEGEWVPYRVVIQNKSATDSVRVPATTVELDHFTGTGIMYDRTRAWGVYTTATKPVIGDTWYPTTTAATPTSQDVPVNPAVLGTGELIKTSFPGGYLIIPPGQYGVLYFQAHLAVTAYWNTQTPSRDGAGFISGSSGHGNLDISGVGKKTVPVPSVPAPGGTVCGVKFYDLNRNGVKDAGEPGLPGWTITIRGGEEGFEVGPISTVTDVDGKFSFTPLPAGTYLLDEVLQPDWTNATSLPQTIVLPAGGSVTRNIGNYHDDVDKTFRLTFAGMPAGATPFVRYAVDGGAPVDVTLTGSPLQATVSVPYGSSLTTIEWRLHYGAEDLLLGTSPTPEKLTGDKLNTFAYTATASGHKFSDLDYDGVWDAGEPGLAGWTIKLWRGEALYAQAITGADGAFSFSGLVPGTYHVTEVNQAGWYNTLAPTQTFTVVGGTARTGLDFGNVAVGSTIQVTKTGTPGVVRIGDTVTYTIVVKNTGATPLHDVTVSDSLLGAVGSFALLVPGESRTIVVTRAVLPGDPDPLPNEATASGIDLLGRTVSDKDDWLTDIVHPAIGIIKTVDKPTVIAGTTVTYTYVVTNTGDTVLAPVAVTDDKLGAIGTIASLAPGASATLTKSAPITADTTNVGTAVGTYGTPESGFGGTVSAHDDAAVDVRTPAVSIIKTVDKPTVIAGTTVTYTYLVTNTGDTALAPVTVTDDKLGPVGVIPMLASGASQTLTMSTAILTDTTNVGTAVGTYGTPGQFGGTVGDDDAAAVDVRTPAVSIIKTVDKPTVLSGTTVTYTYVVTNTGDTVLAPVTVTDDKLGAIGTVASLAPGASATLTKSAPITADTTNVGTAVGTYGTPESGFGGTVSAHDDAAVDVVAPAIGVLKTSDAPDGGVLAGTTVTYTYVVTNTGDVPLVNISLVDDKLGAIGTVATLAVGESATFTKATVLTASTTNTVVATGSDELGHEVSDDDSETVDTYLPFTEVDLAVTKLADKHTADPGDVVTYTVTYWNNGESAARDFTITDDFDERYVTVVDANGGTVADGRITWSMPGPLVVTDGVKTLTYSVRIITDMPDGKTNVDNTVVIKHPDDADPSNDSDTERVVVDNPLLPFTELPFTGAAVLAVALIAMGAVLMGFALRRRSQS